MFIKIRADLKKPDNENKESLLEAVLLGDENKSEKDSGRIEPSLGKYKTVAEKKDLSDEIRYLY